MFFVLSKLFYFFLMPLTWVFLMIIIAVLKPKLNKKLMIVSLLVLLFFGNGVIGNFVLAKWEGKVEQIKNVKNYDIAIVLGGGTRVIAQDTNRVFLTGSADRIIHTAQLYRMGKVKKILFTGGAGNLFGTKLSEAHFVAKLFYQCGVDPKDLILETKSKNTRENAVFSNQILKENHILDQKILIVTSAFHMIRSEKCFRKVGMDFETFGCDYKQNLDQLNVDLLMIKTDNFGTWNMLFHEFVGLVSYKLMGYI